jgi:hypothetical protein
MAWPAGRETASMPRSGSGLSPVSAIHLNPRTFPGLLPDFKQSGYAEVKIR